MSNGKWQKEIPKESGQYFVAARDGISAGLAMVYYHPFNGALLTAGKHAHNGEFGVVTWKGWWWSEPVCEPKPPSFWEWERSEAPENLEPKP